MASHRWWNVQSRLVWLLIQPLVYVRLNRIAKLLSFIDLPSIVNENHFDELWIFCKPFFMIFYFPESHGTEPNFCLSKKISKDHQQCLQNCHQVKVTPIFQPDSFFHFHLNLDNLSLPKVRSSCLLYASFLAKLWKDSFIPLQVIDCQWLEMGITSSKIK
jgi:hypothetical protein